jgi:hypothetical protein
MDGTVYFSDIRDISVSSRYNYISIRLHECHNSRQTVTMARDFYTSRSPTYHEVSILSHCATMCTRFSLRW